MGGTPPAGLKPDEEDRKTIPLEFVFLTVLLLVFASLCWLICPPCYNWFLSDDTSTPSVSFNDLLETYPNKCTHQDKVEEVESNEMRTIKSVSEPDPKTLATPDKNVCCTCEVNSENQTCSPELRTISSADCHEQSAQDSNLGLHPATTTHNNLSPLPDDYNNSFSSLSVNCNRSFSSLPDVHNNSLAHSSDDYGNNCLPLVPDNRNEISDFHIPQNYNPSRLPTILEHPPITSITSRTLSNETILNPSHLPDFTEPSTSSMPDLAPSTRFSTYFHPRNASRLLYHRNTNIDMRDIQNSNPEFGDPDSNLSLTDSTDPPERKLVIVDFHKHDDSAKN